MFQVPTPGPYDIGDSPTPEISKNGPSPGVGWAQLELTDT